MRWDDGIFGVHKEIAGSSSRRIGVLAGPGTGKTKYGLMRRIARLLEEGVDPNRILLVSFTRVAAADLRDKVANLEVPRAEDVKATTLHAFCFGLLSQESVFVVTRRTTRILLDHEADLMLYDIGTKYGDIHERRRKLEAFVSGWACNPDDYPGVPKTDEERDFQASVVLWLKRHKAMLIGEVIPEAYKFLTNNPHADPLVAFDHIIVDEYQDLNILEQKLLDRLSEHSSLCVAGDDDQSIYSVRYANPLGINVFLQRSDVEKHSIKTCGRCGSQILALANSLIRCAPGRNKDPLIPLEKSHNGTVNIVQWNHTDAEIDGIATAITHDINKKKVEAGQVLVLTNWSYLGKKVRDRLVELDIPARSYFKEQAIRSNESREALALLHLVCKHKDLPALRVLLGIGDSNGRFEAYKRIQDTAETENSDVWSILERLAQGENLSVNARSLVERFSKAITRVDKLKSLPLKELVDALFPVGLSDLDELRMIALDSLMEVKTTNELLDCIIEVVTQNDIPQNPNFVRIMSLHKSKGLTCNSVFIIGAVDGVIPTIHTNDIVLAESATREGRRLLYVAITRAVRELTISSSISTNLSLAYQRSVKIDKKTIKSQGQAHTVKTIASPYMIELGPDAPRAQTGEAWLDSFSD